MYCYKCGTKLLCEAIFCTNCGTKVIHINETMGKNETMLAAGENNKENQDNNPNSVGFQSAASCHNVEASNTIGEHVSYSQGMQRKNDGKSYTGLFVLGILLSYGALSGLVGVAQYYEQSYELKYKWGSSLILFLGAVLIGGIVLIVVAKTLSNNNRSNNNQSSLNRGEMTCSGCGNIVKSGNIFCNICGKKIDYSAKERIMQ